MSPAPADLVNALELAGRAASIERDVDLAQLPRLKDAGALAGTRVHGELRFGMFEGRATVDVRVAGTVVLSCQRCLQPCEMTIVEATPLVVLATEEDPVSAGFDPILGDAERLPVIEVIEEQLLLGLPLVATHRPGTGCRREPTPTGTEAGTSERQRPFANLRELLDKRGQ
jgi:DUF177 domain-containing protein